MSVSSGNFAPGFLLQRVLPRKRHSTLFTSCRRLSHAPRISCNGFSRGDTSPPRTSTNVAKTVIRRVKETKALGKRIIIVANLSLDLSNCPVPIARKPLLFSYMKASIENLKARLAFALAGITVLGSYSTMADFTCTQCSCVELDGAIAIPNVPGTSVPAPDSTCGTTAHNFFEATAGSDTPGDPIKQGCRYVYYDGSSGLDGCGGNVQTSEGQVWDVTFPDYSCSCRVVNGQGGSQFPFANIGWGAASEKAGMQKGKITKQTCAGA